MIRFKRKISFVLMVVFLCSTLMVSFAFENKANAASGLYKSVSARSNFTLAIDKNNSLWAWGDNTYGQLGDGTKVIKTVPVKVMDGVLAISAGKNHSLALKIDNTLWAWGDNTYGQIGDITNNSRTLPVQVLTGVKTIAAGDNHSIAVKTDGSVWTWGFNENLQLGNNTRDDSNIPTKLASFDIVGANIVAVAAGSTHSLALDSTGRLLGWGENTLRQYVDEEGYSWDNQVPLTIYSSGIKSISAGSNHSLILKTNGDLLACGENTFFQTGAASTPLYSMLNTLMTGVSSIVAGANTSFAFKNDGSVWAWGNNYCGQLKPILTENCPAPFKFANSGLSIAGGENHIVLVNLDGSLKISGDNLYGQRGDGTTLVTSQLTPIQVTAFNSQVSVSNGYKFSAVLDSANNALIWGLNDKYQLGNGINVQSLTIRPGTKKIAAAPEHMFLISTDDSLSLIHI